MAGSCGEAREAGGTGPGGEAAPLHAGELALRLASLDRGLPVYAEHADMGEGGNVQSRVIDIIIEGGRLVLVTGHAVQAAAGGGLRACA
jgi:hypothetical protein